MAENRVEIAAGALVLVLALGFAAYAGKGMGLADGGDSYELRASFRSIQGVGLGSDVKLAGVKVGTLSELTLNPETYMADAVITVDRSVQLPSDSAILISSEGLLGGNYIELQPGGMPDYLAPGDEIEDTQGAVSLISLLMKFVSSKADSGSTGN
ncbi:outer membrane lipid asymmetry maintenance protein MlaD [Stagnihabitans tardus]|uniref:Outer membrane lipid asymmetry maintenance protein MlaD n=1 Tax=Stagnihabitans tardus TaxID=2699202 RepID=A0AAE4YAI3_9RHOB|nr:outer membrane lipid asymmetry maintenance protein MlaD [Stagnihabitans tardus]NBZ86010.1 outer membrane lipid asymmetry maintenance protein MlaD [Stagnihabitans tardus]